MRMNCENYPFKAPKINFMTPIHHPGVSKEKGEICMKALDENWVPTMGTKHCIQHVLTLLTTVDAQNAQDNDIANEFTHKNAEWAAKAAEMTQTHAKGNQ